MDVVGLVAGSGFASGLSLYATVLLLGLAGRFLDVTQVPEQLTSTPVLVVVGVLAVVEFVADKIVWLDSTWDAVHTVVRPVGAAVLASLLVDAQPLQDVVDAGTDLTAGGVDLGAAAGSVLAGALALVAHSAKASTRVAVNSSPEPFSNPAVSLVEDGIVVGIVWLAIEHPVIAATVVAALTVVAITLVVVLWRLVRRVLRSRRGRPTTAT